MFSLCFSIYNNWNVFFFFPKTVWFYKRETVRTALILKFALRTQIVFPRQENVTWLVYIHLVMIREPISCRAANALTARWKLFAARKALVFKRTVFNLAAYIRLINQARGPCWENIGPRSWKHGPSEARSVQKRPRADILPVRSRVREVNKRFITLLKRIL